MIALLPVVIAQVEAAKPHPNLFQASYDRFVAPSGACYDYSGSRCIRVTGHPTAVDDICFVRHVARGEKGVKVMGVVVRPSVLSGEDHRKDG
jgi:hypothetical protein